MSDQFAPEYIRAIAPYQAGKPISEVAREFGLDENRIIKLASNENPLGMPESAKKAIANEVGETGRYPDANGFALKKVIGERYGIAQDWITLGNGSNDIIELAARTFVQQGQSVVFSEYSFLVYALVAKAIGAKGIQVPSKEYGHDLDAMLKAITADTRLLFLANPNNPTGTFLQPADIEAFLDKVPSVSWWLSMKLITNIWIPRSSTIRSGLGQKISQPAGFTHFFQGIWSGRFACRIRSGSSGIDRTVKSGQTAV